MKMPAGWMSRRWILGLSALMIAGAGCANDSLAQDGPRRTEAASADSGEWRSTSSAATAETRTAPAAAPVAAALAGDYALSRHLTTTGNDLEQFTQIVMTMSDPFFEGRSADTRGMEIAQEYLQFHMRSIGLEPAFPRTEPMPGGAEAEALALYGQDFTVRGPLEVKKAEASYAGDAGSVNFDRENDFVPLGFSATKSVTAPLAFVGYSIEEGTDGYTSFTDDDDLSGRIAVMLRYEPTNGEGRSKWVQRGWTDSASLTNKIKAAVDRGAVGVILVNPPMLDVPDINALQPPSRSRFRVDGEIAAIQLTPAAANSMVKLADPEGRNLADLQKIANETGGVIRFKEGVTATIDVALDRPELPTSNVGGVLPGKGALADEWVIIGAHYDHVGYGRLAGASRENVGHLHPGADDNASGTAGVLVIAKRMKELYDSMSAGESARSVLFLCFAGEEMGLLGADHFVENNGMDPAKVQAMLNMDMIGRLTDGKMEINGTGTAEEWDAVLEPIIASCGLDVSKTVRTGGRSDHAKFADWGVPALHFFTGTHADYHQPSDVASTVNYEGAIRVIDVVEDLAVELATTRARMTPAGDALQESAAAAAAPSGPMRGNLSVRLGVRPETYEGAEPGVLVGEVYPNTSAADGGMLKGDRIIRWDGHDVADAAGMMQRLASHKPGDVARIVVVREGKEVELSVPMKAPEGAN